MKNNAPLPKHCANPRGLHTVWLNFDTHARLCLGIVPAPFALRIGRWLQAGHGEFDPGLGKCELEFDFGNDCLLTHVFHGQTLLATAGLVWSPGAAPKVWDFLLTQQEATGWRLPGAQPKRPWQPQTPPWLAVTLAPEVLEQHDPETCQRLYRCHWVASWQQLLRVKLLHPCRVHGAAGHHGGCGGPD